MVAGTIPFKTPAGQAELSTRERGLSQRHRTVLFLIDGKRPAPEVRSMATRAGVPESCFDELVDLGLVMWAEATLPLHVQPAEGHDVLHVDLPLTGPVTTDAMPDSILPPSRTLYPSLSTDSTLGEARGPEGWSPSGSGDLNDPAIVQAREILLRAVRAEAPLAGSLTLMRLRRARTRADLGVLLDEVEARITKPHRSLAAAQTMRRVRLLLDGRVDSSIETA